MLFNPKKALARFGTGSKKPYQLRRKAQSALSPAIALVIYGRNILDFQKFSSLWLVYESPHRLFLYFVRTKISHANSRANGWNIEDQYRLD